MGISVLIIIGLLLYALNQKDARKFLEKENLKLKQEVYKLTQLLKKNNIETGEVSLNYSNLKVSERAEPEENVRTIKAKPEPEQVEYKKEKPVLTPEEIAYQKELLAKKDREKKNSVILLTGAFLIILAAIVFLTSTWSIIPDILKTTVLVLLAGVFLGGSKIAKEKFNLENTSKAFFYIAMAYVPIFLISISIFGLFGDYLSLYGEGRYIYLTFCGVIVSVLYHVIYKMKEIKPLLYGSILSQLFSIILFSLIFENNLRLIGINLLLYNIIVILLKGNDEDNIFEYIYKGIPCIVSIIPLMYLYNINILTTILLGLLIINFGILEYKKSRPLYANGLNIFLVIFGLYVINCFKLEELMIQTLNMVYIILLFGIQHLFLGKRQGKETYRLGTVTQIICIIIFSLLYRMNIRFLEVELLVYNILLMGFAIKDESIEKIYSLIPCVIGVLVLPFIKETGMTVMVLLFLLAGNFGLLEYRKSKLLYSYAFNISLILLGFFAINKYEIGGQTASIFKLIYILLIYVLQNVLLSGKDRESLKKSCTVVGLVAVAPLYLESIISNSGHIIVKPFVFLIAELILLIITYMKSKEVGKRITSYLIPICFIMSGVHIINAISLEIKHYHLYILFSLVTFGITQAINKDSLKDLYKTSFIASHIYILIAYLSAINENLTVYLILLMAVYAYSYYKEKNCVFKYASYITTNLILLFINQYLLKGSDFLYFIPIITTVAIMNLEKFYNDLKDDVSVIFMAISQFIAFITIIGLKSSIGTIFALGFAIYIVYENVKSKKDPLWNIIPLVGAIPTIFGNNIDSNLAILIQLIAVSGLTYVSVRGKKINLYTVFSFIYLMFTMTNVTFSIADSSSKYINVLLFIVWTIVHLYFLEDIKIKDIFRFLSYCGLLSLYYMFTADMNLAQYTMFEMLGPIIFAIMVIRTIVVKYTKNVDIWEYITFALLYLSAFSMYNSEEDGMLFIALLAAMIILSYMKGYGALFMVTVIAIIINVFALTREFWISVPWWIYLLLVGSVLIFFAMRNEANENKKKVDIGSVVKTLKEKVDGNK